MLIINKKALDTIPRINKQASFKPIWNCLLLQEMNHVLKQKLLSYAHEFHNLYTVMGDKKFVVLRGFNWILSL